MRVVNIINSRGMGLVLSVVLGLIMGLILVLGQWQGQGQGQWQGQVLAVVLGLILGLILGLVRKIWQVQWQSEVLVTGPILVLGLILVLPVVLALGQDLTSLLTLLLQKSVLLLLHLQGELLGMFLVLGRKQQERFSRYICSLAKVLPEDWHGELEALRHKWHKQRRPELWIRLLTGIYMLDMLKAHIQIKVEDAKLFKIIARLKN